ncbi:MAG: hypothetical protein KGL90_13385 [Burkholderiales bacterium]|nr:hypothetical protein [Burkholderiales bacterium]
MRLIRLPLLCLFLSLLGGFAHAASAWEPVRQGRARDDISTWVRSVEGTAVKAFRGVTEVQYPQLTVLALLADVPNLSSWIYQCKKAGHPDSAPAGQVYAQFKGIWPASDRDVLFQTSVSQLEDQVVFIHSVNVEGYPPQDDYVRMTSLNNSFRLTPLKDGWTRVEFETQVNIGGLVPTWLANLIATDAPVATLKGLRQQLQSKPQYQIKSVDQLPPHFRKISPL